MALQLTTYRVEDGTGFSMPCITLPNRRAGGANPRMLMWIYQRHLEIILMHRTDGGSSGAIWSNLCGIERTASHHTCAHPQQHQSHPHVHPHPLMQRYSTSVALAAPPSVATAPR